MIICAKMDYNFSDLCGLTYNYFSNSESDFSIESGLVEIAYFAKSNRKIRRMRILERRRAKESRDLHQKTHASGGSNYAKKVVNRNRPEIIVDNGEYGGLWRILITKTA